MTDVAGDDAYKPQENDQPEKHLLAPGTTFYWYQDPERELKPFFTFQNKTSLVYCNNIAGLIKWNRDFLLTCPAKVSKQFFYIVGIVFHLSLLGIQYK